MRLVRHAMAIGWLLLVLPDWAGAADAHTEQAVRCASFTNWPPAAPEPRENSVPVQRFELIKDWVKIQPYRMLFLGDSITERWDPEIWRVNMAPRGVLNSGVSGDRTEHLMWRLDHGNLAGPPPKGVAVLIGTNDLGHGRAPDEAAEGIRAVLIKLREVLPDTRILLLGLWPREACPDAPLRRAVGETNHLIERCADGSAIVYADIGGVLLDGQGRLDRVISPDLLHFSALGYARLAPPLDRLIDSLIRPPR